MIIIIFIIIIGTGVYTDSVIVRNTTDQPVEGVNAAMVQSPTLMSL